MDFGLFRLAPLHLSQHRDSEAHPWRIHIGDSVKRQRCLRRQRCCSDPLFACAQGEPRGTGKAALPDSAQSGAPLRSFFPTARAASIGPKQGPEFRELRLPWT